jgi:hypothetical protein
MPDPEVARRHNALFDHTTAWAAEHPGEDPDDDLEYVAQARKIMGLPPLGPVTGTADVTSGNTRARELALVGVELRAEIGRDEFEEYWTRGKGLARWLGRPHEWTTLRNLLRKHPGIRDPEGLATKYFHKVKGFYPGADLHRVEHGKPPRGNRIGPG